MEFHYNGSVLLWVVDDTFTNFSSVNVLWAIESMAVFKIIHFVLISLNTTLRFSFMTSF